MFPALFVFNNKALESHQNPNFYMGSGGQIASRIRKYLVKKYNHEQSCARDEGVGYDRPGWREGGLLWLTTKMISGAGPSTEVAKKRYSTL